MSFYSFFGAYAASSPESYASRSEGTNQIGFHGTSRSEAFQKACKALLDAVPSHELLRFLSHESATLRTDSPKDGVTMFTFIVPSRAEQYVNQLNSLLRRCENNPEELAILWKGHFGGASTEDIVSALNTFEIREDLNKTRLGEEGDSAHFAISTLKTLRAAITHACSSNLTLVYWGWPGD